MTREGVRSHLEALERKGWLLSVAPAVPRVRSRKYLTRRDN
jgi:hypothetical protein